MPDFQPVNPLLRQSRNLIVDPIQGRVREDGDAAGPFDEADGFSGCHPVAVDKTGFAALQKSVKGFFVGFDNAAFHQCHRDMRSANRPAIGTGEHFRARQSHPVLINPRDDLINALRPDVLGMLEDNFQIRILPGVASR